MFPSYRYAAFCNYCALTLNEISKYSWCPYIVVFNQMADIKNKVLANWALINRLARHRFGSTALAEEAALFVLEHLEADDWHRVRSFNGKASFATFLTSLSFRLMEDFSRKRFGRIRPPLWVQRLGGFWLLLFRFLCLERLSVAEAVEGVTQRKSGEDRGDVEAAAWTLLERVVHCGTHQAREVPLVEDEHKQITQGTMPEAVFEQEEKDHFLHALFGDLFNPEEKKQAGGCWGKIVALGVKLTAEERLLLKICYQDGLSVTSAGDLLGYNRHQVHGRLRRLLARLRSDFSAAGISEELRSMLE